MQVVKDSVVTLDYNQQGIDGPIFDAMPSPYLNHWFAPGWNIIEVDGHNVLELAYARYKDPGYAWMLSLPPDRNTPGWFGRSPFGYLALSHGEPLPDKFTPPPAPSGTSRRSATSRKWSECSELND